ncbi:MAG: hypothetical protein SFV18_10905 [Bryobacteraceae bacterium]|jgi:anti-sigma factor RsiW|nr:hypothetical protein [Bryobacteraceae bacterium]
MNARIQNDLEDYLSGKLTPAGRAAFEEALGGPAEREMIAEMAEHSRTIRSAFSLPAELAPAPGLYARVMARIENESQSSFWSIFLQPFGARLLYASAALLLLMSVAVFSTGSSGEVEMAQDAPAEILVDDHPEVHLVGEEVEDRGRVFVTLTAMEQ